MYNLRVLCIQSGNMILQHAAQTHHCYGIHIPSNLQVLESCLGREGIVLQPGQQLLVVACACIHVLGSVDVSVH